MNTDTNELGQPIGRIVDGWRVPPRPSREAMTGQYCRVEPLVPGRHARELFDAVALDRENRMWTYLPYGPFESAEHYEKWMHERCMGDDPMFFAIVDLISENAVGVAAYLRIEPTAGSIEVGHLAYSPLLQRTRGATEAMYLMMRNAFALGYRRYEWKCNALNAASRTAAERLGFTLEGIFRQALVVKGRNRDTAWYSIVDSEWPAIESAFVTWLGAANFDSEGKQVRRLADLIALKRNLPN